jgi:hypothetical protein
VWGCAAAACAYLIAAPTPSCTSLCSKQRVAAQPQLSQAGQPVQCVHISPAADLAVAQQQRLQRSKRLLLVLLQFGRLLLLLLV